MLKESASSPLRQLSFLLIVPILSILVSSVVTWDNLVLRVVLKIACLPLVVSIAYEIIKFAGRQTIGTYPDYFRAWLVAAAADNC